MNKGLSEQDTESFLRSCSELPDTEIDLGLLAIKMIAPEHDGISIDRCVNYLKKNAKAVYGRYKLLIDSGSSDDAGTRLAALKHVFHDMQGLELDAPTHEMLESANIIRVIDRGAGHADAFALLYIDAARRNGWLVEALAFPKHLLCRIDFGGQRLIFDPSRIEKCLEAHDLRAHVKNILGENAELISSYYEALSTVQMIVALNNRIKLRYIEMGDYARALDLVERMRLLVPDDHTLLLDEGVLAARLQDYARAKHALEQYLLNTPDNDDKREAYLLLEDLPDS